MAALEAALALGALAPANRQSGSCCAERRVHAPRAYGQRSRSPPRRPAAGARGHSRARRGRPHRLAARRASIWRPRGRVARVRRARSTYDELILATGCRRGPPLRACRNGRRPNRWTQPSAGWCATSRKAMSRAWRSSLPRGSPWPLPLYELALMTATRAREMDVRLAVKVMTPEDAPLAIFGAQTSASRRAAARRARHRCVPLLLRGDPAHRRGDPEPRRPSAPFLAHVALPRALRSRASRVSRAANTAS